MPETKQAWRDEGLQKQLSSKFAPNRVVIVILMFTRGAKHNDPKNLDPEGDHWTLEMIKESGEFVTKRHVYSEDKK